MKIKFDPNLEYQKDAIQTVIDLYDGQPRVGYSRFDFDEEQDGQLSFKDGGWSNYTWIEDHKDTILKNVQSIQERNNIKGEYRTDNLESLDFSIEMETGTGKTYVYLRTIHELYQEYGFSKFIIVVPSIAIREGVKKNLNITSEHFANLYDNPTVDWFIYDSEDLAEVRKFASSNSLQIMVTTIQSFRRDETIMNQYRDTMMGRKPAEFIRSTRPIMVLDEPQNMETEKSRQAIASLNPLCTLRYSATHRKMYNLLYNLNPVDAYNMGLVKTIEVASVREQESFEDAYIKVKDITPLKTKIRATIEIEAATDKGLGKEQVKIDTQERNDLYEFSNNRAPYEGYVVSEINSEQGYVKFENGEKVYKKETVGEVRDQIQQIQIEETIREHFEKEKRLKDENLKTLSLFFIDKVQNYRNYDREDTKGKFAKCFEEIYEEYREKEEYKSLNMPPTDKVHGGYFAKDNDGHIKDITERAFRQIEEVTDLIMEDKERLLSDSEPLRFIFSHSALREGWDNPNIFQICTLNETESQLKKRQEIGRGLRLPVNEEGERVHDENINILTIVANESYELFARALQNEMEEAGVEFERSNVKNRKDRKTVKPKKGFKEDKEFKDLWEKITYKTRYKVEFDSDELIEECAGEASDSIEISEGYISIEKVSVEVDDKGIDTLLKRASREEIEQKENVKVPDALSYLSERTNLTKATIFEILEKSDTVEGLLINPQQYLDQMLEIIKYVMQKKMVDGIKYEKIGDEFYEMNAFAMHEWETYEDKLWKVKNQDKTLYDYVVWDSEVEKNFAKDLDNMEQVTFYLKLPSWFVIETPLGTYNPDWAVSLNEDEKLYFIAETKSKDKELRPSENMKIKCGGSHFDEIEDVDFKGPISRAKDLTET